MPLRRHRRSMRRGSRFSSPVLIGALVVAGLAAAAVGARAANLGLPGTNAGQVALEGCASGLPALGGDRVFDIVDGADTYRVHVFDRVGATSLVLCVQAELEYVVVAGGGAGQLGGGTGGGVVSNVGSAESWAKGTYPVVVGAGGVGGASGAEADGGLSILAGVKTDGGLAGRESECSGGDGAGGAGGASTKCSAGGPGGAGLSVLITGAPLVVAGGGGGADENGPRPLGGDGGGGDGGVGPDGSGASGTDGTGGGGGGALRTGSGRPGSGGSGVVIVRYRI